MRWLFGLLAGAALTSCSTSGSSPPWPARIAELGQTITASQKRDALLQDIGWKLVRNNAAYCAVAATATSSIGLQLQDMASYRQPEAVRLALGVSANFAVQSVAKGSPADMAGIRPNVEVTSINGDDPNVWPAKSAFDWERQSRANDAIDAALAENGEVTIGFSQGPPLTLKGLPVCQSRFELRSGGGKALADGKRVQLGSEFAGFDLPEDQLAAAIAHELAHNILQHRKWLSEVGRKRANIRLTEREADRLMPWLLANAGYDPAAALRFMQEWGPAHDGGIFRARTHDGWDERAEFIAAELAVIETVLKADGRAEWSLYFRREIVR